jgi:hypothetical protein
MKKRIVFRAEKMDRFYALTPNLCVYGNRRGDWAFDFSILVWRVGFVYEKIWLDRRL